MKSLRLSPWAILGACLACLLTGLAIANTALPGVNSTLNTVFTYAYEVSPDKPTYSATSGAITLAANPTAVCALQGSATKMIRVRRVFWQATLTTAAAESLDLIMRTATYTLGNGTAPPVAKLDQNSASATAVLDIWTANPTLPLLANTFILRDFILAYSAITSPLAQLPYVFPLGELDQAPILRSASQWLEVDLNGSAMTGGTGYCTFEWTEE